MELQKSKQKIFFVLRPIRGPGRGVSFGTGRKLLGSSESCEIVLPYPGISPIHAVIEIGEESFKIYDMNSATGVLINGQKILSGELKLNDSLSFGKNEFKFEKSQLRDDIPSVLSSDLPPIIGSDIPPGARQQNVLPGIPGTRREKRQIPKTPKLPAEPKVPTVEYPLTKDPNAAFSEYIFEDADQLYPIFKYDVQKSAVEIIIIHKEQIYTVDYLPLKNGMFSLVGNGAKKRDVEYPYLGKMEKCPFVEISEEDISIYPLSGYDCMILSDDIGSKEVKDPSSISLRHNDILRFAKQDIQIFVRRTETPPEVEPAPFFRRDQEFKKYLVLTFLFVFLFLGVTSIVTVDKELEDEKNPERIATVLYKKKMKIVVSPNRAIVRTPKKKPIPQKSPQQLKIKKTTKVAKTMPAKKQVRKKKTVVKPGRKKTKITKLPKKAKPRKGPKKIAKKVSPSRPADTRKRVSVPKRTAPRRSARVAKSKGHVDTYKAINFKSTISSVLAKGGATKSVRAVETRDGDSGLSSFDDAGTTSAALPTADVVTKTGDLEGVTNGKLDSGTGVKGFATKKSVYTMGIPSETVVLGSMDPDIIRRILKDHISQFRRCYQSVLDRSKESFTGVVPLNFVIGASGHVSRAGVKKSDMPGSVKRCVINVLKGIRFPEPMGGGVVEVNQPFYFYPRMK